MANRYQRAATRHWKTRPSSARTPALPSFREVSARATREGAKTPSSHNRTSSGLRAVAGAITTGIQQAHVAAYVRRKNLTGDDPGRGTVESGDITLDGAVAIEFPQPSLVHTRRDDVLFR